LIFINNKYTKWYNAIIATAQQRDTVGYVERHHIIPKSLGGPNDKSNLVRLTAREHYICHLLLTKMLQSPEVHSMVNAIWRMANSSKFRRASYKISSRQYEILRKARKNVHMSSESKAKLSATKKKANYPAWNKGIPRTPAEKAKMSESCLAKAKERPVWNKNRPHSQSTLDKITERARNRPILTCPHCDKHTTGANFSRWHGDNCKAKKVAVRRA
jgi:hypothetical protein